MVKMGVSIDQEVVGGVSHLTKDSGAGGRVVGANNDCVKAKTGPGTLGGIKK